MRKVLVVYKKSAYELYSSSPDKAVRDFANGDGGDAVRMRKSHDEQLRTLETVIATLEAEGIRHRAIYRGRLREVPDISKHDLVVSVGGDGTFLEVSHYLTEVPLLGVNSDGNSSVGFYCTAKKDNFADVIRNIAAAPKTTVSRLELILDGKRIPELVLNDMLVAHVNPAAMTRYDLTATKADGERYETRHRSSGLLVCTPAGSTAWMYQENGAVMPLGSTQMQYFSRGIRGEKSKFAEELTVRSLTREGMIYIDGEHLKYAFTLGSTLHVRKGTPLTVIGNLEEKRKGYTT